MAVTKRLKPALALLMWFSAGSVDAAAIDWWMTPDQQGRYFLKRGDYARAARSFENPFWKGLAFYAAEDFVSAAAVFATVDAAEGYFYLGNAWAHQDQLREAVAAYEQALEMRPDFPEAAFNLDWVRGLLELEEREYEDFGGTGGKLAADKFVFSERGAKGTQEMTADEARAQGLSDAQLEEMWMRRVQTTPGDFLSLKFAYQLQRGEADAQ